MPESTKGTLVAYVHMYPPMHLAGAELMLHDIFRWLVKCGWECRVILIGRRGRRYGIKSYRMDGVLVSEDECTMLADADVILTHLDRTPEAESIATHMGVPLVHLIHNHVTLQANRVRKADLVVYNSEWLSSRIRWPARSLVVHPPVFEDDYRVDPVGECITLVNLQRPKGVDLFYKLARLHPELRFLGVTGGYGEQVVEQMPNVDLVGPLADMRSVYRRTRVLLMPSAYESYGRVAVEAACSGIPTLAAETPGLRESLGNGGTFVASPLVASWNTSLAALLLSWDEASARARGVVDRLDPERELQCLDNALTRLVREGRASCRSRS